MDADQAALAKRGIVREPALKVPLLLEDERGWIPLTRLPERSKEMKHITRLAEHWGQSRLLIALVKHGEREYSRMGQGKGCRSEQDRHECWEHNMEVPVPTDLQGNQDCGAHRIVFPMEKLKNLFFHPDS